MNHFVITARLGLAVAGAAALIGAAAPARAEGSGLAPLTEVDGLVLSATDPTSAAPGTLVVHPAAGSDVTLFVTPSTRFRKAGGVLDTPDEVATGITPPVSKTPSPTWFVGLFARAYYNSANMDAFDVALSRPEPQLLTGVVDSATATDLTLNVKSRGEFHFSFGTDALIRLNGLAATGDKLVAGDQAEVLFWATSAENEALRVSARTPPPQHFEGTVSLPAVQDGSFTLTRGTSMTFGTDGKTQFLVNGNPGSFTDLQNGEFASVYYLDQGGIHLALAVIVSKPATTPAKGKGDTQTGPGNGGDKGKGNTQTGPGTGNGGDNGNTGTGNDGDKGNGNTGTGDGSGEHPNTGTGGTGQHPPTNPGSGKPTVVHLVTFQGQVASVSTTDNSFSVKRADKTMTFKVGDKTTLQVLDKPAGFTDLKAGEIVAVIYAAGPDPITAVKVYILKTGSPNSGDGSVHK